VIVILPVLETDGLAGVILNSVSLSVTADPCPAGAGAAVLDDGELDDGELDDGDEEDEDEEPHPPITAAAAVRQVIFIRDRICRYRRRPAANRSRVRWKP
jgi:hypothetical protein